MVTMENRVDGTIRVAIHQPNFCPYFGFFNKMINCDLFVILDDVQIENGVTNRNKIITENGEWVRMKVPVTKETKWDMITDVEIDNSEKWGDRILEQLSVYKDSKYFKKYEIFLRQTFKSKWTSLYQLNMYILNEIKDSQQIRTPIIRSSELGIKAKGTERIIEICRKLGADEYLSGIGGHKYLNAHMFKDVKLTFQEPKVKEYPQIKTENFVSHLSILDMMFNVDSIIDYIK